MIGATDGPRWWTERAWEYLGEKRASSDRWRQTTGSQLVNLVVDGRRPAILRRAGIDPLPTSPRAVTADHVRSLIAFGTTHYTPQTLRGLLWSTRAFLEWSGNPVARERDVWQCPTGDAVRPRWLGLEELVAVFRAAEGRERAVVLLGGTCGLRSVEYARLHVRDVDLTPSHPTIRVWGKGRSGGKWRVVPLSSLALPEVARWAKGRRPEERLLPRSLVTLQLDVVRAGRRAGIRVSSHDLRRTFGRLAYQRGVPLPVIQQIFGHASIETTRRYLGICLDDMREGIARLDAAFAEAA
ncbi:MAG TPA: site-specific integrase [Thermoplasmata archaeon]|nr:site-specific integrase [Thermoplasmata archaeon]